MEYILRSECMNNKIDAGQYLQDKGVKIVRNEGKELVIHCLFSGCDNDSKGKEAHLYIENETGRFNCKKCDAKGGIKKLREHFGDSTTPIYSQNKSNKYFTQSLVEECAKNLPDRIRKYLNGRAITDEVILKNKIGFGNFYGSEWITIPIKKQDELEYSFFVLRKDPENRNEGLPKNLFFPKGKCETTLYGEYAAEGQNLVICEGIMDCLSLLSSDVKSVCSTGGCMAFKENWVDENLLKASEIYVAYDKDEAGDKGADKVLGLLKTSKYKTLFKVNLPEEVGHKGDVNDYLAKCKLPVADLFSKYAESFPKKIDTNQFKEMSLEELENILSGTIIGDRENKLITFFCQLSAFTQSNQFNVMYNSPSSTGKSYTAIEVSKLFPKESLLKLGNCSATAFFHDSGKYNKETNTITVDLSNKILIFTENQHYQLLEKLRGFLSHDEKIMNIKITDKNQKGGNKTKNIELIGYASVIFCTASLKSDAQEKTRFIMLSPEISDVKIAGGIRKVIQREGGGDKYENVLELEPKRKLLKSRIEAIKNTEVKNIYISEDDRKYLDEKFFKSVDSLKPKLQRDIQRVICIAKAIGLLNIWFRDLTDGNITLRRSDIDDALTLYSNISISQNLGISPYLYQFYKEIIRACYEEAKWAYALPDFKGVTYQDIMHFKVKHSKLDYSYISKQIMMELEACGLVERETGGVKVYFHVTDN